MKGQAVFDSQARVRRACRNEAAPLARLLPQGAQPLADLVCQWTRTNLELQEFVLGACAAFYVPGHIPAIGRPDPATLPTGIGTVDPSIHSSGEETHRIRHA